MKYRDKIWNHKEQVVPIGTAILGCLWFSLEPNPEPVVVIFGALLAAFVVYVQKADSWHSVTQGQLYIISFRGIDQASREMFVKEVVSALPFVVKWQVQGEGEWQELFMDLAGELSIDLVNDTARKISGKVYWVKKNGHLVWETEAV